MADATLAKLIDLIAAPSPELRQAALKVAGSVGSSKDKALVKGLLAALDDDDAGVRAAAIDAVGQLKLEEALKRLEHFVRAGGPELVPAVHAASQPGARRTRLMGKLMDGATPPLRPRIA